MMWSYYYGAFVSEPVGPDRWRVVVRPEYIDPPSEGAEWIGLLEAPDFPLDYNVLGGRLSGWGRNPEIVMGMSETVLAKMVT